MISINIQQAFNLYEMDKKIEGYSPYTLKAYRVQTNLLHKHFGEIDVGEITHEQLKGYLAKDMHSLKPSSIGHRVRYIKSLFRWLVYEGHISKNPAYKIKEPKQGMQVPRLLEIEEVALLKSHCQSLLEHGLVRVLYATGSRIGEIHRLNIDDINLEDRSVIVSGKGIKERTVFFDSETKVWLKRYINSRDDDCEALFVTERNPKRRSSIAQLRYIVKRVAKRTNIQTSVFPHRLRHSRASHMYSREAPLDFIQGILGHARSDTTRKIYIHVNVERRKQLYDRYS